jgi:hypothetical protein
MSLKVHAAARAAVPTPVSGTSPQRSPSGPALRESDSISQPRATPSVPAAPPPKHIVDGTPEIVIAGLGIGGLAVGMDVAALSTAAVMRAGVSYVARLAQSMLRCVSDPVKTGEHIAEGLVGGAAWAGAAAGVAALAEATRTHGTSSHGGVPH